jgi:2-oxoglutarate dehydrogenase complex dehydrogenase (E1) component-like enzyme
MVSAPILHVNGDKVDDVSRAMKLALAYQQKFRKDVVIVSTPARLQIRPTEAVLLG